ncbi:hypothetical protein VTH82DRAFT_3343 [Thermothelomyces myriococcoides]
MGIASVANACIHLQNASRARFGLTSIPNTKYNLRLMLPGEPEEPVTTANVSTRRIWVGLKYWNNEPVLRNVTPISRPSRLVTATVRELEKVSRGFSVGQVKGLSLGESLFVSTDRGVLEIREALERRTGGLVLCKVS